MTAFAEAAETGSSGYLCERITHLEQRILALETNRAAVTTVEAEGA
jgi:hypothetical protein